MTEVQVDEAVAVEAWRRAAQLNAFFHPEPAGRHVPLVLPESLPGGVPPVGDYYAELISEIGVGGVDAG